MYTNDQLPNAPVKVIIAGAGLGGVCLGALLHKAGVPFVIFEQADRQSRLGSALGFPGNMFPLFEQMGILPQFMARSKVIDKVEGFNEKLRMFLPMNFGFTEQLCGYMPRTITHPDLFDILIGCIPASNVVWGKRVVHVDQTPDMVTVRFTDGASFSGQILVGADGTHSGVRESIYKPLAERGELLHRSDKEPVSFNGVCLVGETKVLKPNKFPRLLDDHSTIQMVYSEKRPYFWATTTTPRNTICWIVIEFYDKTKIHETKSHELEYIRRWKSTPAGDMCEAMKDFPIPCGDNLTLEDLMAETSRSLLSKVMNEEKFYHTWYSGRTVLMGDACHKMGLAGGMGALNAIQDACVLANYFHSLPLTETWKMEDVTYAFKGFKNERYSSAKHACDLGHSLASLTGKNWSSDMTRTLAGLTPAWLWKIALRKMLSNRPQASFLPYVEPRGRVKPAPQPSLHLKRLDGDEPAVV